MSETTLRAVEADDATATAQPVRILIIDDEAAIRESLETLLRLEDFAVETAIDGPSGLEKIAANHYDLLLLDLALPGESGIDLLPAFWTAAPSCRSS